jgi:mono/diheme cytochrome c family protein
MSKALRLFFAGSCVVANIAPTAAADPDHGKQIAQRWCASCHLVESRQTNATDQAPPFTHIARIPDFNENKLAFLLLLPHPNMPTLSLTRTEVADLVGYIRSLK